MSSSERAPFISLFLFLLSGLILTVLASVDPSMHQAVTDCPPIFSKTIPINVSAKCAGCGQSISYAAEECVQHLVSGF